MRINLLLIGIVLSMLGMLGSCTGSKKLNRVSSFEPIIYPSPPDTARIQYLTSFSGSSDIVKARGKFKRFILGDEVDLPILKPYGICMNDSKIYVCDGAIGGLQIVDIENRKFEYFTPVGRGKLSLPMNCFIDDNDDLYITDVVRRQVVIFDKHRNYKGVISGEGNFKPTDIYVTPNSVFVTDPDNHRINVYNKETKLLDYSFPEDAELGDENWLYNPLNIYIAGGKIYITDFGQTRIKIFNIQGDFLKSIGDYGSGLGQFVRPKGICVDRDMNLYVVDAGFENVQIFNDDSQLLLYFGGPYNGPGDMYLPAKVIVDYDHLEYYQKYVHSDYELQYLIIVSNQYGPEKISIYGRIKLKKQ